MTNDSHSIMKHTLAFFLTLLASVSASAAGPKQKPNVVVILADDLGWADLSCYGSTFHETPHLDELAREGMRFTQGYAAHSYCSPTRAALLTGRDPARLKITDYIPSNKKTGKYLPGVINKELPLAEVTLAEILREHGFATWHVGKWHLGHGEAFLPERQGFDINIAGNQSGAPASFFWPYGHDIPKRKNAYHGAPVPGLVEGGKKGEHLCDRITREAIGLIEKRDPSKPFFLYLPFYDVHTPIQAKPDLIEKYKAKAKRKNLPTPDEAKRVREGDTAQGSGLRDHLVFQCNPTYAAMVETMDDNVGRLMAALDRLELTESTLVLFTSDNGGLNQHNFGRTPVTSNAPLRAGKGWLYEGGVREPWIVRLPGVTKPGSVCDQPIVATDVSPTVLEVCGLPVRPDLHLDGKSILPLLKGGTEPIHESIQWHFPHYGNTGSGPCSSIRVGDWKLIEWFENDTVELFDLATDMGETTDLAAKHPDKAAELKKRLAAWREDVDASMLRPRSADTKAKVRHDSTTSGGAVFVLPYFQGNGESGVYFAWSRDGLKFESLNDAEVMFPAPDWGDESLTRDPSIVYRNGVFHMVWSTSWKSRTFGYARSTDLRDWTARKIEIWGADTEGIRNTWSPELHWDAVKEEFLIIWSTTTEAEKQDGDGSMDPHNLDHRTYATRTRDFTSFTKPQLFFSPDPEFSVIDPYIAHDDRDTPGNVKDDRWIMVIKHEMAPEDGGKNLRLTFSAEGMQGPYDTTLGPPVVGTGTGIVNHMGEGPSLLKHQGEWWLYWDSPGSRFAYCLATSPDLKTWKNRSAELSMPISKMRHGTVFRAPLEKIRPQITAQGEFAATANVRVEELDGDAGYRLHTLQGKAGFALKKLDRPIRGKATFECSCSTAAGHGFPNRWVNGFLTISDGVDPSGHIHIGAFFGGQKKLAVIEGPLQPNTRHTQPLTGNAKPLAFTVRLNLAAGEIILEESDGARMQAKLSGPIERITHIGYSTLNAVSEFSHWKETD